MTIPADPTPEERTAIVAIRRTQRVVLAYGAAIGGLIVGIALAVRWSASHQIPAYHCHPWSYLWMALLAFVIFGPLFLGRSTPDLFPLKLLAIGAITAFLCVFSINWSVVETCSPL
jgi:hypothetical protein